MTDPEHDEAFETYLKRRSVFPEALDEEPEPPAALDQRVLDKARKAIRAQAAPDHGKQQMARAPRWAMPVALAATILLCLSVVLNISLNTNRPAPNPQRMSAARVAAEKKVAERTSELPPPAQAAGAAPSAPPALAAAAAPSAPAQDIAPVPGAAREPSATYGEAMAQTAIGGVPLVASRSGADNAATLERRAGASASGTTPVAPADDRQTDVGENSGYVTRQAARAAAAGPHPTDPKVWLQQIDALRAAGKIDEANAEMHRFRAAFPGYMAKPAPPASSEPPK
jgi:hypothetical protein